MAPLKHRDEVTDGPYPSVNEPSVRVVGGGRDGIFKVVIYIWSCVLFLKMIIRRAKC